MSKHYQAVVVGTGVAGVMAAKKLVEAGVKTLILEAGKRLNREELVKISRATARWDSMAPYPAAAHARHADPIGDPDYITSTKKSYDTSYVRHAGGTTWHWGSVSWRFIAKDFKLKSHYGIGRDWPIGYDDLERFYSEAEYEMGVSGTEIPHIDSPRSQPFPMASLQFTYMDKVLEKPLESLGMKLYQEPVSRNSRAYDNRPSCCGNNNCIPICPIGAQYCADMTLEKVLKMGADIRYNAVVNRLEDDEQGNITGLFYLEPDGREYKVTADHYILSANAIETVKILLNSKTKHSPTGIANQNDLVGRNLMDHPHIYATFDCDFPVYAGRGPVGITGITQFMDGEFRKSMAAKKFSILNGNHLESVAEQLIDKGYIGEALNKEIARVATHRFSSYVQHEQLPDPNNRIYLSDKKDMLGLPMPVVEWSVEDYVVKSAEHSRDLYHQIAEKIGAKVHVEMHMGSDAHTLGTTIMGNNEHDSVVDKNCAAHAHKNLFLNGGTVFSSASSVNPTLTIGALGLRVGEHVAQLLKHNKQAA
ncbi:MAG: GMC family oxidoreductase [Pseudomonadota bacterium]